MAFDIVPGRFWPLPQRLAEMIEDEDWSGLSANPGGLSVSEDEKHVFVEAAVPGVDPKAIEITFDKGMLWIKGEGRQEDEDKKKKYYRRASSSFSYRLAVPGELDQNNEPEADIKHGIVKVTFAKAPQAQPKKIQVKAA